MKLKFKIFLKSKFPALVEPKAINTWALLISVEAITCLLFLITKPPRNDIHFATIIQSLVFTLGMILTIISLSYLNKTAVEIRNQTQASQRLAELTSNLLKVELARDTQSNLISGYLMAHAKLMNGNQDRIPGWQRYEVIVEAHINNQSVQPISRVTAKLHLNPRIARPAVEFVDQDIPISVAGPKEDRRIDISDSFHSPGVGYLEDDLIKERRKDLRTALKLSTQFS